MNFFAEVKTLVNKIRHTFPLNVAFAFLMVSSLRYRDPWLVLVHFFIITMISGIMYKMVFRNDCRLTTVLMAVPLVSIFTYVSLVKAWFAGRSIDWWLFDLVVLIAVMALPCFEAGPNRGYKAPRVTNVTPSHYRRQQRRKKSRYLAV